jgi:hypothetical protein
MAPITISAASLGKRSQPGVNTFGNWRSVNNAEAYIVEAWGEGFMFGALLIMSCITIANMRRGVLLHKLILFEVSVDLAAGLYGSTSLILICEKAFIGHEPRHILLHGFHGLRLVSLLHSQPPLLLILHPQRRRLDEDPALFPWISSLFPTKRLQVDHSHLPRHAGYVSTGAHF